MPKEDWVMNQFCKRPCGIDKIDAIEGAIFLV
jgi:hypothetical protein